MVNQQLIQWMERQTQKGFNQQQMHDFLLRRGYKSEIVKEHLNYLYNPPQTGTHTPSQQGNSQANQSAIQSGRSIKHRNPVLVLIFSFITLGIYSIYWLVSTTNELRSRSSSAPNPWLLLLFVVPVVNFIVILIYYWKYSKAINELTGFGTGLLFILWIFISPVAMILAQVQLNKAV